MRRQHWLPTAAWVAATAATAGAQEDLRDVVTLTNGKEVRGRIAEPFAPGDLVLRQGGKRVRVARAEIASIDRLADRIREFLDRRDTLRDNPRAQWILVEWAASHGLQKLAQLQAMAIAAATDDERAHAWLGHRQRNKVWLWELDNKWLTREQLASAMIRSPIDLPGERFTVRTDGDLQLGIAAAFDLERLGVYWIDTFGADLQLAEVLEPLRVFVHRDATSFPKWGFRPIPLYTPEPHGDIAHTFYTGPEPGRPKQLFFVGTQGLLYRTMIGNAGLRDERDRICPWLEIGLPMFVEQSLSGPVGFAVAGPPRAGDLQATQASMREYPLAQLLHLPMYGGFYLMDDTPTATNWSAAAMLVRYLLRPDNVPDTRAPFLAYVRAALRDRRGDSSTLFDTAMGRRIEELELPFRRWLQQVKGN